MSRENAPSSYNVRDNLNNKIVANYSSNTQATEYCWTAEPKPSMNNNTSWRFTIEPVRPCDETQSPSSASSTR